MKVLCCCILLLSQGIWLSAGPLPVQKGDLQPDLGLLKKRVTRLWTLIKERKKADALEYVEPATRNTFVNRREARILSFTVGDLQLDDDPTEVRVTVKVEIRVITSTHSVTVPITERWVFHQGTWLVQIEGSRARELFSRSRANTPVDNQKVPVQK